MASKGTQLNKKAKDPKYANAVNGFELVVTYIPSHRPGEKMLRTKYQGHSGNEFMIHGFREVHIDNVQEGIKVTTIESSSKHNCPHLIKAPINPGFDDELGRYWAPLVEGKGLHEFLRYQHDKHGKYCRLTTNYFETVLNIGKEFVAPDGRHYIMDKLKILNYEPGKVYNCMSFVDRLSAEIGVRVKVKFRKLSRELYYLDEVSVLFDTSFQMMPYNVSRQNYFTKAERLDDAKILVQNFLLEDTSLRFGEPAEVKKKHKKRRKRPESDQESKSEEEEEFGGAAEVKKKRKKKRKRPESDQQSKSEEEEQFGGAVELKKKHKKKRKRPESDQESKSEEEEEFGGPAEVKKKRKCQEAVDMTKVSSEKDERLSVKEKTSGKKIKQVVH